MSQHRGVGGFKASETLLGIETGVDPKWALLNDGFKASETLLGIETTKDCVELEIA